MFHDKRTARRWLGALLVATALTSSASAQKVTTSSNPSSSAQFRQTLTALGINFFTMHDTTCYDVKDIKYKSGTKPLKYKRWKKPRRKVLIEKLHYKKPVAGGCGSNGPNDTKNCCNYENIPKVEVTYKRDAKLEPQYEFFWPSGKLSFGGFSISVETILDVLGADAKKRLIGYRTVTTPWVQKNIEIDSVDFCDCEKAKTVSIPVGPTVVLATGTLHGRRVAGEVTVVIDDEPPIDSTPWVADAQDRGQDITLSGPEPTMPSLPNFTAPILRCTASNDVSSGKMKFELETTYEWTSMELPVFESFGMGLCSNRIDKVNRYWWISKYTVTGKMSGESSCTPKVTSELQATHLAHADCKPGCKLDSVATSYEHAWTRELVSDPPEAVLAQKECSIGPGITQAQLVIVGYNFELGPWEEEDLDSGMGGKKNFCNCEGDSGSGDPDDDDDGDGHDDQGTH